MRELKHCEIYTIHGGGFRLAACAAVATLSGMALGAVIGANYLEPTLDYWNPKNQSLTSMATNYLISYKYGHLGLDSKTDILGAAGGAIVGAVVAPTLVALLV